MSSITVSMLLLLRMRERNTLQDSFEYIVVGVL